MKKRKAPENRRRKNSAEKTPSTSLFFSYVLFTFLQKFCSNLPYYLVFSCHNLLPFEVFCWNIQPTPLLTERCQKEGEGGPDWPKIAEIDFWPGDWFPHSQEQTRRFGIVIFYAVEVSTYFLLLLITGTITIHANLIYMHAIYKSLRNITICSWSLLYRISFDGTQSSWYRTINMHYCSFLHTFFNFIGKRNGEAATDLNKAESEKIFLEHKTKVSYQGRSDLFGALSEKFKWDILFKIKYKLNII